tara:strand:+ start:535 stop:1209 length:675 start_codon:yes stop_codon:yes gene_type:complete
MTGLVLAFFLLPTRIGLRLQRPSESQALNAVFSWSFFAGIVGLCLSLQKGKRHLSFFVAGHPLAFLSLTLGGKAKKKKTAAPKKQAAVDDKEKTTEEAPSKPLLQRLSFLADLLLRPMLRFLPRLKHPFGLYKLRVQGEIGFADPCKTGKLCGYIYILNTFKNRNLDIDIYPNFTSPGMRGQLQLIIRFHLGYLLFLILALGLEIGIRWLILRLVRPSWRPGFI